MAEGREGVFAASLAPRTPPQARLDEDGMVYDMGGGQCTYFQDRMRQYPFATETVGCSVGLVPWGPAPQRTSRGGWWQGGTRREETEGDGGSSPFGSQPPRMPVAQAGLALLRRLLLVERRPRSTPPRRNERSDC